VVFVIVPRLPQHPEFEGKFIYPSDLFSRSPYWLQCVNTSKVGVSAISRLTDICRCDLDSPMSTPGSIDSIGLVWAVSGWLHGAHVL